MGIYSHVNFRDHEPFPACFGQHLDPKSNFSVHAVGIPTQAFSLLLPHDGIWIVLFLLIREVQTIHCPPLTSTHKGKDLSDHPSHLIPLFLFPTRNPQETDLPIPIIPYMRVHPSKI